MKQWREEGLHALLSHPTEQEFFDYCSRGASALGFDHCSFGIATALPMGQPKILILNNYPRAWWDQYQAQNYVAVDPTIHHAVTSTKPLLWSRLAFTAQPAMWDDVTAHGLNQGWGQPTRDEHGTKGMLTLARGSGDISEEELSVKSERMNYIAQMMMAGLTSIVLPKVSPEYRCNLSPREKEVLRWAADGKTTYEISRILTLSNSAVNFHIKNTMIKLNANNKTHAVLKAAMLGLLY